MSIYVGNLDYGIEREDLNEVFNDYGNVKRIYMPTDRETGRKRGFAFIEMESQLNEDKAIEILDQALWMGREIKVNKARPRQNRSTFAGNRNNRF